MGKNGRVIFEILTLCFVCIFLCGMFVYFQAKGCFLWTCAPRRSFDVLDVGIPDSYFPKDVDVSDLYEFDYESIYTDARNAGMETTTGMHVVFVITRFSQERAALKHFQASVIGDQTHFSERRIREVDLPQHAIEYSYLCGEYSGFGYMCSFVGHYDEFVLSYFTDVQAGVEQVDNVVRYLDERMGKLLSGGEVEDWQLIQGPYW
jgi:hypothetical protein